MTNAGNAVNNFGGGGSGGSIFIKSGVLTGGHTGVIQARGGSVSTSFNGGGGAGGRIAVYYNNTVKDAFYSGTFDTDGGSVGSASEVGASGTVYQEHYGQNISKLIVDNKGGWAMETEIVSRGQRIEVYNGFSWSTSSYSKNGFTMSSSCGIYTSSNTYYSLSALFDQSYKTSYFSSGIYRGSYRYIGNCHSGYIRVVLPRTMLINTVRIFPIQGTKFKVSSTILFLRGVFLISMLSRDHLLIVYFKRVFCSILSVSTFIIIVVINTIITVIMQSLPTLSSNHFSNFHHLYQHHNNHHSSIKGGRLRALRGALHQMGI